METIFSLECKLFKKILKENDFYQHLHKNWNNDIVIRNLVNDYDDRQPISIYGFLDSIENYFDKYNGKTSIDRAIAYLDQTGEWRD